MLPQFSYSRMFWLSLCIFSPLLHANPQNAFDNQTWRLNFPNVITRNADGSNAILSGEMLYIPSVDGYRVTYVEQQQDFSNQSIVDPGFDLGLAARLDEVLQKMVTEYQKPGALIRVERAGKVYRGVRGMAKLEAQQPLKFNDRWRIASNTKPFVAQVVLQLVQEQRLKLDEPLMTYLPELMVKFSSPHREQVTVRQLLQHNSGLANYVRTDIMQCTLHHSPLRGWTPTQLLDLAATLPPVAAPGERFYYSNTNYILLGLLIEKLTGLNLETAIDQRIIKPWRLFNTQFPTDPSLGASYSYGYTDLPPCLNNGTVVDTQATAGDGVLENATFIDPSAAWAAGAMVANAEDLSDWTKLYTRGWLLSDPALFNEQMKFIPGYSPEEVGFTVESGLGILRINQRYLGYAGEINGYDNIAMYDPLTDTSILVMVNRYDSLNDDYLHPELATPAITVFQILPLLETAPATTRTTGNKTTSLFLHN